MTRETGKLENSPPPSSSHSDREAWLLAESVGLLFSHPQTLYPSVILCGILAVVGLQQVAPLGELLVWCAGTTTLTAARWGLWRSYRRDPERRAPGDWRSRYFVLLLLSGLAWAYLALAHFPPDSLVHQLLIAFLLVGLSAAAVTVHSALPWSFLVFAAPPLLALVLRLVRMGGLTEMAAAFLTLSFLLGLSLVSASFGNRLSELLDLRYYNERLKRDFGAAHRALGETSRAQELTARQLHQRDEILRAVRFAAERLLNSRSWDSDPVEILQRLGEAARVSHVYVVHHRQTENGELVPERTFHWRRPEVELERGRPAALFPAGNRGWAVRMRHGEAVWGRRLDFELEERELLRSCGVASMAVLPIMVEDQWWGVLGLEHGEAERTWSHPEVEALAAAANMLGAAIQGMQTKEALRTSDDRFRLLAENTSDLICLHHTDGSFVYLSPSCEALLGYRPHELLGKALRDLVAEEDRELVAWPELGSERVSSIYRASRSSGETLWFETTIQTVRDENEEVALFVSSSRDITVRKLAQDQLFREKELAQVTLKSIGDGVVTTDQWGDVQYMNPVAQALAGVTAEEVLGRPLVEALHAGGRGARLVAGIVNQAFGSSSPVSASEPILLLGQDGQELAVEVLAAPIQDRDGQTIGTVTVLHDVTSTRALAAQLSYQATHDSLTGLMNRREFEERLAESVKRRRSGEHDALCYLDLDQFKVVNDTCGHIAGDELLRQLAGVLKTKLRSTDMVARLGGDEFGILLTRCMVERAQMVANGICEAIRSYRFTWQDKVFQLGVSIGVVPISSSVSDVTELLSAADAACYAAKDQGRNRVHMFKPDDRALQHRKGEMEWVAQIHSALEHNRFRLHYQPIFETEHREEEPRRIEILLTMIADDGEVIPPGTFIPAAERFNTMPSIDRWVVKTAVEYFAEHWRGRDPLVSECFINLSGTSLADPSFGDFVRGLVKRHRIPSGVLCFEITETAAITNLADALSLIQDLRGMGCRFALDDFGSGLSSFAYLRSLPVDFLKIDGIFVRDIHLDSVDYSIVESINKVGQMLGLKTIAEFVESEPVFDRLVTLGVDFVQGYGLARPAPVDQLLERISVA